MGLRLTDSQKPKEKNASKNEYKAHTINNNVHESQFSYCKNEKNCEEWTQNP